MAEGHIGAEGHKICPGHGQPREGRVRRTRGGLPACEGWVGSPARGADCGRASGMNLFAARYEESNNIARKGIYIRIGL